MEGQPALLRWIDVAIVVGAGSFLLALLVSAVLDPRIRLLHTLQALICAAVILLARRNRPWGFGGGFAIALLWNYTNLFVTAFILAGLRQLWVVLTTGTVTRELGGGLRMCGVTKAGLAGHYD